VFARDPRKKLLPRLVRLHLKNDPRSIEGVLVYYDRDHYILQSARVLSTTSRDHDRGLDDRTWWPREDVLTVQELEPR
jgi:hypothetical protein